MRLARRNGHYLQNFQRVFVLLPLTRQRLDHPMILFENIGSKFERRPPLKKNLPRQQIAPRVFGAAIAIILSATASLQAELIPMERLIDWTAGVTVGVPGGIPTSRTRQIDVTQAPYNADKSGASNAAPAIQAAIDAASAGDVVYLPAGVYRVESILYIRHNRSGVTVRGAGIGSTIIDARVNTVFAVGSNSDYRWNWPSTGNTVTGGLTKGSTVINIPNTDVFLPGQIIQIAVENQTASAALKSGATPTFSTSGYPFLRRQLTRVISKTPTSLKVYPAINYTPDAGLGAKVNVAQFQGNGIGIEDMTLDGTNGPLSFPIMFEQCYGSWVKGVKITKTGNYGIYFTNSLNCEVRQSVISERKTGGSNGAGILAGTVSSCLFEDNIILDLFPAVEINFSSTGNVIAYNVMENSVGGTLNTNHAPHNSFNLYEGNVTPNIQSDGYFGSASDDTFFRNWIHGTNSTKTLHTFMVSLNRFTRNYSFLGNIFGDIGTNGASPYSFGNPNMGNSMFTNTAKPSAGSFWRDWDSTATLTVRASDTAGSINLDGGGAFVGQLVTLRWNNDGASHTIQSVASVSGTKISWTSGSGTALPAPGTVFKVFFGPAGYQESDLDVERTTIRKGNYFFGTRSVPYEETIGSEKLPSSLFRNTKPDWFGDMQWPPFGPESPAAANFASIPAGYRYLNGVASPPANPVANSAPSNVKVKILQ